MAVSPGEGLPPPGAEAHTPLLDAMEALDLSTQAYLGACTTYAGLPNNRNEDGIDTAALHHIGASREFLLALADGLTVDAYREAAISFLMVQDSVRVDALNGHLTSDEAIAKRDAAPTIIDRTEEPLDDEAMKRVIGLTVAGLHEQSIGVDTQSFINAVDDGPVARKLERRERYKEHVIDVGKAALGAVIGSAITVWALQRRR